VGLNLTRAGLDANADWATKTLRNIRCWSQHRVVREYSTVQSIRSHRSIIYGANDIFIETRHQITVRMTNRHIVAITRLLLFRSSLLLAILSFRYSAAAESYRDNASNDDRDTVVAAQDARAVQEYEARKNNDELGWTLRNAILHIEPPPSKTQSSAPSESPTTTVSPTTASESKSSKAKPNLLFLMLDQLRFDTLGYMQKTLGRYKGKLHIKTPNIDRLLVERGVAFHTAYCVSPSCAPSRATVRTGNSLQRAAIKGNRMLKDKAYNLVPLIRNKVERLETFEQLLVDAGYQAVRHEDS